MNKAVHGLLVGAFLACGIRAQLADGTYPLTDTFNNRPASAVASTLPGSGAHVLGVEWRPKPAPTPPSSVDLGWQPATGDYRATSGLNITRFRTQVVEDGDGTTTFWWLEESTNGGQSWTTLASGTM